MQTIVNHAAQAAATLYNAVLGRDNSALYSRLPLTITRTSSSAVSYELGKDAEEDSWWPKLESGDNEEGRLAEIWTEHKRKILLSIGLVLAAILAVISTTIKRSSPVGPLVAAALANTCEGTTWTEVGWYQHPTVNPVDSTPNPSEIHTILQPLEFQRRTSQACADLWISRGELCEELHVTKAGKSVLGDSEVDVAWSFVEPTPLWRKWQAAYASDTEESQEEVGTGDLHFRSFDEIRYSIRSVVQNLPFVKKLTLLATTLPSVPPPAAGEINDTDAFSAQLGCRVAQTPEWMDHKSVKLSPYGNSINDTQLEVLSHWEQFDPQTTDQEEALGWKHSVLPTFNSHSIESQLYNLPSPSETVLYMNNDNYIGRPLTPSDMSTRILGPVFKIYPHSWSTGALTLEDAMAIDGEGNARVLPNTIRHLDNRFGRRDRNYPEHVAAVLPAFAMDEVAKVWADELKETAGVRFRGRGAEVWLPLMVMYYIIEKQREATLWSFVVARSDADASNSYRLSERQKMFEDLGGEREGEVIRFRAPKRTWSDAAHKEVIQRAGITVPNETQLYWTAMNGYPYVSGEEGNHVFPNYDGAKPDFCTINIGECFGRPGFFDDDSGPTLNPEEVLKRVAFDKIECGDCLIAALLAKSGERGFDAFLPDKEKHRKPSKVNTQKEVALIGGWNKHWNDTGFAIRKVIPSGWNTRDFAVRLIQRYTFSFGETPTAFNELNDDPGWIGWLLWRWSEDKASFMALNDHVTTDNVTIQQGIQEQVTRFQEKMWPNATVYEKDRKTSPRM